MTTPRQRPTGWWIVVLPIAVAVLTSGSIQWLQTSVEQYRQAELLTVRIEGLAHRLIGLEWQAEGSHSVTPQIVTQARDIRQEFTAALAALAGANQGKTPGRLRTLFTEYERNVGDMLSLVGSDRDAEAHEFDQAVVDPSYDRLLEGTAQARSEFRAAVQRRTTQANLGTLGALVIAALAIVSVYWRYDQVRRAAHSREQHALQASEERFHSLVRNATDVIQILAANGTIEYSSPAAQSIWGYQPGALEGRSLAELVHPDDRRELEQLFEQVLSLPNTNVMREVRIALVNGGWRDCELVCNNLTNDSGIAGLLATYHDVSERKALEQELIRLAFNDSLTLLPNRAQFSNQVTRMLHDSADPSVSTAILFLDLDNFKLVNDTLGHQAGDQLLVSVAERLRRCIRPGDVAARLGGDEFAILLRMVDLDEAARVAQRILEAMRSPFQIGDREVFVTCSIGVALGETDDCDAEALLREADVAMYRAKSKGRARYEIFDRSMNALFDERLELETNLRRALGRNELRLYYHPIIQTRVGKTVAFEALVRWQHPTRGLMLPAEFIPLAEDTGMILPIGDWVLEEACRQAKQWQLRFPSVPPMAVAVNLSARQFQRAGLVDKVASILQETGLDPGTLTLEITESVMMHDVGAATQTLLCLRALGVRLALDDFGTGYSSLNYLKRLPVDVLKIDRSFIKGIDRGSDDLAIVQAIIALSKALGMDVTAEGTEAATQVRLLEGLGCDFCQGYLFSEPIPPEAVPAFLSQQYPATAELPAAD